MPGWTLADTHPTHLGRVFQRPLSAQEHIFSLVFPNKTTSDISRYVELRLVNGVQDANLFSNDNIVRAWVSTKRRYPLAGAVVQRQGQGLGKTEEGNSSTGLPEPYFVVHESNLSILRPREIVFGQVADAQEVQKKIAAILDGPRPLSDELLLQLQVFREADSEKARDGVIHVFVMMSHCVADEMASRTIVRCWLDTLARGGEPDPEPAQMPLEDRLSMAIPVVELPVQSLSPARRRWRRAAAAVIAQLVFAKLQQQAPLESHTLPVRPSPSSVRGTGFVEASLTQTQSADVIAKCRQHKITFGNAYPVLAQVAMTRVLYRRYLHGDISEEEWEHRRKMPYVNDGLVNMRPYLNKSWFEKGGAGEFVLSMAGSRYRLPFMTLGRTDSERGAQRLLSDGPPPFSDLLTFDRFLHRAGLVKKQAAAQFNRPLPLERDDAFMMKTVEYCRFALLQQEKHVETGNHNEDMDANESQAIASLVSTVATAYKGSTLGNMDPTLPFEYPLPRSHALSPYSPVSHPFRVGYVAPPLSTPLHRETDMTSTIVVEDERLYLNPRNGEVYLSAVTWRGQLNMYAYYDEGTFNEEVVGEWLDEVREAVLWYLG